MSKTDVRSQPDVEAQMPAASRVGRSASAPVPPLQSGDRLTRNEFERRYKLMPPTVKAELIEEVVYMPSPVRATSHTEPHAFVMGWLGAYWFATPGIRLFDNATLRLDLDNEPQPDAALCVEAARGGHTRISADDYLEGAPELVVEVAASSAAYDVGDKLKAYRRNGVSEYIVWMIYEQRLEWWRLDEGAYVPMAIDADGIVRSHVFPGLYLHVASLLDEDRTTLLATLQRGIASAEHAAFVHLLAADEK